MQLTIQQLSQILKTNPNPAIWLDQLNTVLPQWHIDTPRRVAMFLAQYAHESCDFVHLQENLNYGAAGLLATFPHYFDEASAAQYAHHPEMIANRVYSNRMGNGDEKSGEGYKYRGRGICQLTGKANYHTYSDSVYGDDRVVDNPDLLLLPHDALLVGCWYWGSRNLNPLADVGDNITVTKKINGGTLGLDQRTARYNEALKVLGA